MRGALIVAAFFALTLYLTVYPPGLVPVYRVATMNVELPEDLVKRGYPHVVYVPYDYIEECCGMDYSRFLRKFITDEGLRDWRTGRIIKPQDIDLYFGAERISYTKAAMLLMAVLTAIFAIVFPVQSQRKSPRAVGGVM